MKSLKKEILQALKKSNNTNEILDKISNYQNVLMKNYNNQILSKEIKNKILDTHTELQNLGKAIYRQSILEDYDNEEGKSAENGLNPVLNKTKIPQESKTNNTQWIMPCVGNITSSFGWRIHPVYKTGKMHNGWDIGVPVGTPIKAVADGKVYYAGKADGYGKMVVITHRIEGEVITSEYGHISSWNVSSGQQIKQGQVIAKSGNEGISSGPHLHLTIRKGPYRGIAVDPGDYIRY